MSQLLPYTESTNIAVQRGYMNFVQQTITQKCRLTHAKDLPQFLQNNEEFMLALAHVRSPKEKLQKGDKMYLLTLTSDTNHITWHHLAQVVKRLVQCKNLYIIYEIEYEQRSLDISHPSGWHVHLAVQLHTNKADAIKRTCAAYKQVLKGIDEHWRAFLPSFVDLRICLNAREYVQGDKRGDYKQQLLDIDARLRNMKKNNVVLYYNTNVNGTAGSNDEQISKSNQKTESDFDSNDCQKGSSTSEAESEGSGTEI